MMKKRQFALTILTLNGSVFANEDGATYGELMEALPLPEGHTASES